MVKSKLIDKKTNANWIVVISVFSSIVFILSSISVHFFNSQLTKVGISLIPFILLLLFVSHMIWSSQRKFILLSAISFFFIEALLLFVTFRKMRLFFSSPAIGEDKIIGFTHYFDYPFYFDTLIFLLLSLTPFILFYVLKKEIRSK